MKKTEKKRKFATSQRLKRIELRDFPLSTRSPLFMMLNTPNFNFNKVRSHESIPRDLENEPIYINDYDKNPFKELQSSHQILSPDSLTKSQTPNILTNSKLKTAKSPKIKELSSFTLHNKNTFVNDTPTTNQSRKPTKIIKLSARRLKTALDRPNFSETNVEKSPDLIETYKLLEKFSHKRNISDVLLSAGLKYKNKTQRSSFTKIPKIKLESSPSPPHSKVASPIPESYSISLQSLNYIIEEMQKPDKDVETMYSIIKHLKFFIQYKADIVKQMLRVAKYEYYTIGQIIFKEGEIGRHLFVVLRGSIAVQKEPSKLGELPYIINSRYDGEVIGEYAIVRGNINHMTEKRSASCFAGEACHLLKISADDYMQAVRANIDTESKILHFLCSLGPFEHIPPIDLALLANTLNKESFGLDKILLNANQIPKGMYIVYAGRVKITYPAKVAQYDKETDKLWYKMSLKDFQLPRGSFFGQRVLLGDRTPTKYSVVSASAQTSVLVITPHEFSLLFTFKDETLRYLNISPQFDINIPYTFN